MFNSDPKVSIKNDTTEAAYQRIRPLVPSTSYSKLSLRECFVDEYGTLTAVIDGGLNGSGNWGGYLQDLTNFLSVLANEFETAYVIYIDNDCVDDVFVAHIGVVM